MEMRRVLLMLVGCFILLGTGCAHKSVPLDAVWAQRIEILEEEQKKTAMGQQELDRKNQDLERTNQDLQDQLFDLETRLGELESDAVKELSQGTDSAMATAILPVSSKVSGIPVNPQPSTASTGGDPEYDRALQLYLTGHVVEGRNALQAYKDSHPDSPLMPNVLYWLGETLIDQKHYDQAILTFKQIPQNYPKHSKAPDALFKIVTCYIALEDKGNAGFYTSILLNQYAQSSAARLAKKRFPKLLPNG